MLHHAIFGSAPAACARRRLYTHRIINNTYGIVLQYIDAIMPYIDAVIYYHIQMLQYVAHDMVRSNAPAACARIIYTVHAQDSICCIT